MKLNQKDTDILAALYDSSSWQVFRKHFLEQRQMELAQTAAFLPDMDQVLITRGRIMELKDIEGGMQKLRKNQDKRS
jgi:hypothetical protein